MPSINDSNERTIDFYNRKADQFVRDTHNLDMSSSYAPFCALLKPGAHILDAGCGSGRDSRYFLDQGYKVTAFDASRELANAASELLGQPVLRMRFDQVEYCQEFDAVWACASLLHIPKVSMRAVIARLSRSIVEGGVFFLSFKYGNNEEFRHDRHFSDYDEEAFSELIKDISNLSILEMRKTADERPQRDDEYWLSVILQVVG